MAQHGKTGDEGAPQRLYPSAQGDECGGPCRAGRDARHQVADVLYKIWPQQPLEPGEYAVVEYTEGKGNTQIWDFGFGPPGSKPTGKRAKPAAKK